jgi:hypothetical protein
MTKGLFFLGFFLLLLSAFAGAQSGLTDVDCYDNYNFGGIVFTEFYSGKTVYAPGDVVSLKYSLVNAFQSPLPEGAVKAVVLYRGIEDVDRTEDDDVIDVFYPLTGAGVQNGGNYSSSFSWRVPGNAMPGVYVVSLYFSVDKKYNIAGVSFLTSFPAKSTTFSVSAGASNVLLLNKTETYLNGNLYMFRAPIPQVHPGSAAYLKTRLENPSGVETSVEYKLFSWDDSGEPLSGYGKSENVSGSKVLEYSVDGLSAGVYLMIISSPFKVRRFILPVRFYVAGEKPIINWAGLGSFPVLENVPVNVSFCVSNSASSPVDSAQVRGIRGRVVLLDGYGNELAGGQFYSNVSSQLVGKQMIFTSKKNITKLVLKTELYDGVGKVIESSQILYDYTKFLSHQYLLKISDMNLSGSRLTYSLKYSDEYGDPLSGHVVIYLLSSGGSVAYMDEMDIPGSFAGSVDLSLLGPGVYVLKVLETGQKASDSKELVYDQPQVADEPEPLVDVSSDQESESDTPEENNPGTGASSQVVLYVLLAVVAVFAAFFVLKKKNKPKNES